VFAGINIKPPEGAGMSKKKSISMLMCIMVLIPAVWTNAMHGMHGDSAWGEPIVHGYGYLSPGVSRVDAGRINRFLGDRGISSFMATAPSVSIGGHREYRRLVLESGLTMCYRRDNVNANLRTSLSTGDLLWNHGINVLPVGVPATLFPYIGMGIGVASLHVRSDKKEFGALLASSEPDAMLWQASFLLNGGIGADLIRSVKGTRRGMVLGLRGGYQLDPFSQSKGRAWRSGRTEIENMPILRQNGLYVRLILGGW
jgi:hypothetical protein